MCSRDLGADQAFAWPGAEIAVMGPEGAANIIFRKEISEADDPEGMRQEKLLTTANALLIRTLPLLAVTLMTLLIRPRHAHA